MTKYRYDFDHKAKKAVCPQCGQMRLRTYINVETREPADPKYGVCDRTNSCGYHHYPEHNEPYIPKKPMQQPVKRTDWRCPPDIVAATQHSAGNQFATWLVGILGDAARQSLRMYRVGTYPASERFPAFAGAMVYWQIGHDGLHRTGKVIPYHSNGKRVKDCGSKWIHHMLFGKGIDELGIGQVLFGEHLIYERPEAEVCVVESEKSAIICSIFYPDKVWVATGGSENFSVERCIALQGRRVWVFPDVGMYADRPSIDPSTGQPRLNSDGTPKMVDGWATKAIDIEIMCESLHVSDVLEAMGVETGSDLADLLIWEQDGEYINAVAARGVELFSRKVVNGSTPTMPWIIDEATDEAQGLVPGTMAKMMDELRPTTFDATDKQRQRIDAWNAAVAAPTSPATEIFERPAIKTLVEVMDIDTVNYTVRPHEDRE